MRTDFVQGTLEQALYNPNPRVIACLIPVQTAIRNKCASVQSRSERLRNVGVEPSAGSGRASYDNAVSIQLNGLYEAQLIHRRAPSETKVSAELAALQRVSWPNHQRLL